MLTAALWDMDELRREVAAWEKAGGKLARRLAALGISIAPAHVVATGGYRALVALLHLDEWTAAEAVKALLSLSSDAECSGAIGEAGGSAPLTALLVVTGSVVSINAAEVLCKLAENANNRDAICAAGGIPLLVALGGVGSGSKAAEIAVRGATT